MTNTDAKAAEAALLAANAARIRALLAGDLETVDRHVCDEMIYISPAGKRQTKAQVFAGFRSGALRVERMEIDETSARLYGPVGIVGYRADYRMVDGDAVFAGRSRSTAVYHHRDGRWQLVSQQVTAIADDPV